MELYYILSIYLCVCRGGGGGGGGGGGVTGYQSPFKIYQNFATMVKCHVAK